MQRILVIEDDPDYAQFVSAVLATCGNMFETQSASDLAGGLARIGQYLPELILLDLNLPDSSGYETFLRVRESAGEIPIIVLTALDDDRVALRAVEEGAQDYLVKNLIQPKLISRCVHMAFSRHKRSGLHKDNAAPVPGDAVPATVLSFMGSKGGVGTTTTAVNVAALLAQNGFETVAIELQQGRAGTLSLYLQAEPAHGLNSLLKRPADTITPSNLQECLAEALPGLYVLSPASSPGAWRALGADHAHAIIGAARRLFRFVVLDLPARIDEGVAEALKLSNSVCMIVDRESASVHCGAAFREQVQKAVSRDRDVRLVLVDRTAAGTPIPVEDIKKQLKMHPLAVIPAAGPAIALSHAARTPLALLYPEDGFSLAHFELAERLLPPRAAEARSSPPDRLSRKAFWRTIPETTYS